MKLFWGFVSFITLSTVPNPANYNAQFFTRGEVLGVENFEFRNCELDRVLGGTEKVGDDVLPLRKYRAAFENTPTGREIFVRTFQEELLRAVTTVKEAFGTPSFCGSAAAFAIEAYLGPSAFRPSSSGGKSPIARILDELIIILSQPWMFDEKVYQGQNAPLEVATGGKSTTIRFYEPEKNSETLAWAHHTLKLMAISTETMTNLGILDSPLSKAADTIRAGIRLDCLFRDSMTATILHELCHLIDPTIDDIRLNIRALPAWVDRSQLTHLSKSGKSIVAYGDYVCRLLLTRWSHKGLQNAESIMRAILSAYIQLQRPSLQVVSHDIKQGTISEAESKSSWSWFWDRSKGAAMWLRVVLSR